MKIDKLKIWELGMKIGNFCGCHQKPERSFFIRQYQFPVCARCLGVWLGYVIGLLTFKLYTPSFVVCILLMCIMLFDWLLQYNEIIMSNNHRRLITGMMCGYGLIILIIKTIIQFYQN